MGVEEGECVLGDRHGSHVVVCWLRLLACLPGCDAVTDQSRVTRWAGATLGTTVGAGCGELVVAAPEETAQARTVVGVAHR
jgi:hypothetical protein